jgi:hypothetical protein
MNTRNRALKYATYLARLALTALAAIIALPSQAAFHLWQIRELYSNSSGDLQYIEMFCPASGQTFVNGQQISVSSGVSSHLFTLNHGFSGDSLNHALLFGTAGIQAAGAPAPDYVLPNGFLFTPDGSISFFGANGGPYSSVPTDGVLSRTWGDGNSQNSPQNFAGQVGFIAVPEPAAWGLLGMGTLGCWFLLRRRSS